MSPRVELIWTNGATADLQTLYVSCEDRSPGSGDKLSEQVSASLETVRTFPRRGSRVADFPLLRRVLVGRHRHYGVYYAAVGARVIVTAVVDLRSDPETILRILSRR